MNYAVLMTLNFHEAKISAGSPFENQIITL